MGVDLTKPTDQPQEQPADDDQALTAREELLRPLKACGAAIAKGSPLLLRWIARTLWAAVRDGSRTQTSGEGGIGGLAERLALGALVVALGGSALAGLLGALWLAVAPYAGWAGLGLILAWCVAAMCFAVATPEDDQETAGEEELEDDDETLEEEDDEQAETAWEDAREKLRLFVEHRVAAGAANCNPDVKGRGARVDDLLAEQQRHGALSGVNRKGMIELLEKAGIAVREQMKFRVREETPAGWKWKPKNVPGVHLDDLAQALGRTPQLPAHLVPDLTPSAPPHVAPLPAQRPGEE